MKMNRVLILGGGFGGIDTILEFKKRSEPDREVGLVTPVRFFPGYPDVESGRSRQSGCGPYH
jgi:NADH dehydrogenase FAD-containing subunit